MASKQINSAEVLKLLKSGNQRYSSGKENGWRATATALEELAQFAQQPHAVVVSCSDSRCPMELIFCSAPGELFSVRTAGHVVDEACLASIEFGVAELNTPLLAVVGHTNCGAVKAAVAGQRPPGTIPMLLDQVTPAVQQARKLAPQAGVGDLVTLAVEQNVLITIKTIQSNSQVIQKAIRAGEVVVAGGIYDMASGKVRWLAGKLD